MARHCPECGFVVAEGANYCPKCGAFQGAAEAPKEDATTATYVIDDQTGELKPVDVGDVAAQSGALVVRSGGGRVGQSFPLTGEKMTIGRSPEAGVFLDDSGSLNGTYVNRQRVDSHRLADGDELQIGKFKLTFFAR